MSWGFDIGYFITNTTPNIGITENPQATVQIYPDPAQNFIIVDNATSGSQLKVYDFTGNCLLNQPITGNGQRIDLQKLQNGFYFVEISGNKQTLTRKIIVNR